MAEVYIPDDDHLSPYPKAPPPSPELQQRSFNDIFEGLSPSKFESPCRYEQRSADTFGLTQLSRRYPETVASLATHPLANLYGNCNAENHSHEPNASPTRLLSSSPEIPSHSRSPEYPNSRSHSNTSSPPPPSLPPLLELSVHHQLSPQQVGQQQRLPNGFSSPNRHLSSSPSTTPRRPTSQSCNEVHSLHTHLPHSYDTAQLSELAGGGDLRPRGLSLNSSFEEDPGRRSRKISLKRKNDELDSLQFSFEYSYSSSSGESESWVVIDPSSYPMGKKACQDSPVTRQRASSFGSFIGQSGGQMSNGAGGGNALIRTQNSNGVDLRVHHSTGFHPQRNSAPNIVSFPGQLQEQKSDQCPQASSGRGGHLTSLPSIDSEMDCCDGQSLVAAGRLDSLDSMDIGGSSDQTNTLEMDSQMTSDLCGGSHPPLPPSPHVSQLPQIVTSAPGRSYSSGGEYSNSGPSDPLTDSKFNMMDHFFASYHGENSFLSSAAAVDPSDFNFIFSKSL